MLGCLFHDVDQSDVEITDRVETLKSLPRSHFTTVEFSEIQEGFQE